MSGQQRLLRDQTDLFVAARAAPAGFVYQDEVISPTDERALLDRFRDLPFKPFEFHGFFGNRRVVSFGWRYDFAGGRLRESEPVPAFLLPLREQAAAFAGVPAEGLQQILINEYAPGAGIGWHRDKAMFEDVIAVSLASPSTLRLRRKDGTDWERASQTLAAALSLPAKGTVPAGVGAQCPAGQPTSLLGDVPELCAWIRKLRARHDRR